MEMFLQKKIRRLVNNKVIPYGDTNTGPHITYKICVPQNKLNKSSVIINSVDSNIQLTSKT